MFHEVVLTAPDIDADVFRRDIAPAIVKTARPRDALRLVERRGPDRCRRRSTAIRGPANRGELVVVPGIDTIDVSAVDTSLLGHSYYGNNDTVLTDLAQLLHDEKPPTLRNRLKAMALGRLQLLGFPRRSRRTRSGFVATVSCR